MNFQITRKFYPFVIHNPVSFEVFVLVSVEITVLWDRMPVVL